MKKLAILIIICFSFVCIQCQKNEKEKQKLHVPSPNWEDQIIYFLMLDRFADGDTTNNDQGVI